MVRRAILNKDDPLPFRTSRIKVTSIICLSLLCTQSQRLWLCRFLLGNTQHIPYRLKNNYGVICSINSECEYNLIICIFVETASTVFIISFVVYEILDKLLKRLTVLTVYILYVKIYYNMYNTHMDFFRQKVIWFLFLH